MTEAERREISSLVQWPTGLLPLLSALAVIAISVLLYFGLGVDINLGTLSEEAARHERAEILWGASVLAFMTSLVWTLAISCMTVSMLARQHREKVRSRIVLLTWVAVGVVNIAYLLLSFASSTRGSVAGADVTTVNKIIESSAGGQIGILTTLLNYLNVSTIAVVLVSLCLLAVRPHELTLGVVAQRVRLFSLSLYGSAISLGCGLLQVILFLKWAVGIEEKTIAGLKVVSNTLGIAAGVAFSVLLVAIYLPVALVHDQWLDQIVQKEAPRHAGLDVPKWLIANGVKSSDVSLIAKGAAMLVPFVTGLLSKWLAI